MHGKPEKQESPADRKVPDCAGFPTSWSLVGLDQLRRFYFGGLEAGADMAPPLLLLSAGAAGVALLLSAGGVAIGAAGAAAGAGAESWLLLQAESTSAAAKALRTSFVFIDESPELVCKKTDLDHTFELVRRRKKLAHPDSIESAAHFKLPAAIP
jgi:hypothetical protein